MTFGRSVTKDLQEAGIELDSWYELAHDRALWREVVRHLAPPDETKNARLRGERAPPKRGGRSAPLSRREKVKSSSTRVTGCPRFNECKRRLALADGYIRTRSRRPY